LLGLGKYVVVGASFLTRGKHVDDFASFQWQGLAHRTGAVSFIPKSIKYVEKRRVVTVGVMLREADLHHPKWSGSSPKYVLCPPQDRELGALHIHLDHEAPPIKALSNQKVKGGDGD
jgi:hypothetical protein